MLAFAALIGLTASIIPVADTTRQAMAEWRPDLVKSYESLGGRNIPNFRFDAHHTAGGPYQITDTNWRKYAPALDIDISKWPNAGSAPEFIQGQVAFKMWAVEGYLPWTCCNANLRKAVEALSGIPPRPAAQNTTVALKPLAPSASPTFNPLEWHEIEDDDSPQPPAGKSGNE